jgi:hypothetical protein
VDKRRINRYDPLDEQPNVSERRTVDPRIQTESACRVSDEEVQKPVRDAAWEGAYEQWPKVRLGDGPLRLNRQAGPVGGRDRRQRDLQWYGSPYLRIYACELSSDQVLPAMAIVRMTERKPRFGRLGRR